MRWLRVVLLQDIACLWNALQDHPVVTNDIFQSDLFQSYRGDLETAMANTPDPADMLIRRAIPLLADRMDAGFAHMSGKFGQLSNGKMDCASLACLCQLATTQTDKQKI
jgi:hypothetical protein